MKKGFDRKSCRRAFLRYLAMSPLLAQPVFSLTPPSLARFGVSFPEADNLIGSPQEAINVFDFQKVAQKKLPPAHYGYLATGVDNDVTLRANREGFKKFQLRVRRLIDVRQIDLSVDLFGTSWKSPIILAPIGNQKAFHPEGDVAVARAARSNEHLQILSTVTTSSLEEVTEARGAPVWFQLYPTDDWNVTKRLLERAEANGCPAVVLTVDLQGGSNRETLEKFARRDERQCSVCHDRSGWTGYFARKRMFDGLDLSGITQLSPRGITWDFVKRLKENTSMKVLIKGIVTWEDAELCLRYGADGIIISNHGGRAESSGRSTIDCLPEIVQTVAGRIPVLIDGGFRRGTDIFKALALGANAICIGRPYAWGLASFGQEGVETVLNILRRELAMVMRQAGTPSIEEITRAFLTD